MSPKGLMRRHWEKNEEWMTLESIVISVAEQS